MIEEKQSARNLVTYVYGQTKTMQNGLLWQAVSFVRLVARKHKIQLSRRILNWIFTFLPARLFACSITRRNYCR